MCVRSIGLAEDLLQPTQAITRGVDALYAALGPEASVLLAPVALRSGEGASFEMILPEDFLGQSRTLYIGFPSQFPRYGLKIRIDPSPWLQWPHVMRDVVCLFGLRQRPVSGTPEQVVDETVRRIRQLLTWVVAGSDAVARQAEFNREVASYWSEQLGATTQQVVLLDRPDHARRLFALTDMRARRADAPEIVWLADDPDRLTRHWERMSGQRTRMRSPATPAFFAPLVSLPAIHLPPPGQLIDWVAPHIDAETRDALHAWNQSPGNQPIRWLILQLPNEDPATLYAFALRSRGTRRGGHKTYGRRAGRRSNSDMAAPSTAAMEFAAVHALDRGTLHSRDLMSAKAPLANAHVVLVGVGTLGSTLAVQLARVGVGRLTLIDPDILVDANLGRHVLGADDLGRFKAQALRERLRRDIPTLNVEAVCEYVQVALVKRPDLLDAATLVAITTADWPSEIVIWEAKAAGATWSLVQAWSEPFALVGHALVAPPGAFDARSLFQANGQFRHRYSTWPDDGIHALPGCGATYIPGGPVALAPITAMTADAVLQALTSRTTEPVWLTSLGDPAAIIATGGGYDGPTAPEGVSNWVMQRSWPDVDAAA